MTHLTAEELIDALDGAPATPAASHLGICAECRTQLDRLRATFDAARAEEVFETLMGDDVSSRKTFIQQNANDVRFLDI